MSTARLLKRLENLKGCYGDNVGARKVELLGALERRDLARSQDVDTLHEVLCFLRAYPDDHAVLQRVENMLARFDARPDLRRHREQLADSGIAGTTIHFRFYWITACWLARHWPDHLAVDWADLEHPERLERLLPLLVAYYETPALESMDLPLRDWLIRFTGPGETDASFLIRRFDALHADFLNKESLYEDVDLPIVLSPGRDTPSRTRARYGKGPVVFQTKPLERGRPSLVDEARRPPKAVRAVSAREGHRLIGLAREAMVTRSRDLDAFAYADARDVRVVDCGDGLEFACYGTVPERRLMLEAVYGFLTLKNGVPIGYVLASALMGSSEVAYNVFDTYRAKPRHT